MYLNAHQEIINRSSKQRMKLIVLLRSLFPENGDDRLRRTRVLTAIIDST